MTLKDLKNNIDKLILRNPEYLDLTIIYASDDEGNDFYKVDNTLSLVQIHDLKQHNLELVGFKGESDVNDKDINAIIIN